MKTNLENQIYALRDDLLKAEFWRLTAESWEMDYDLTAKNLYRMGWRKVAPVDTESEAQE